ncbi:hypothetical protein HZA87_05655 [Candidatus Uhrbacteria bacterium]|nr:hypothetical protein [Candidatus Uhrbacteria bacterium]
MTYKKLPMLLVALTLVAFPWSAGATVSSTTYQINPEQGFLSPSANGGANASGMLTSTSYRAQGAVEPYTGSQTTTSYQQQGGGAFQFYCGDGFRDASETCDGADLNSATCQSQGFEAGTLSCSSACAYTTSSCTTASGGGGGGGGGGSALSTTPDEPEVSDDIASLEFTYSTSFLLYGSMDTDTDALTVNGSSEDVELIDEDSWKAMVSLSYGLNTFTLVASQGTKDSSETVFELYRRLIGDITGNDTVDDYDLSKLVGLWGKDDSSGDFNGDEIVDDYDFSMMVARWGTSV